MNKISSLPKICRMFQYTPNIIDFPDNICYFEIGSFIKLNGRSFPIRTSILSQLAVQLGTYYYLYVKMEKFYGGLYIFSLMVLFIFCLYLVIKYINRLNGQGSFVLFMCDNISYFLLQWIGIPIGHFVVIIRAKLKTSISCL